MPRPTKYTEPRKQAILEGLKVGMTEEQAAARAGIDQDTLTTWKKRYPDFLGMVTRARLEGEARFVSTIAQASAPHDVVETVETINPDGSVMRKTTTRREFDWRAAAWRLERMNPDEFGNRIELRADKRVREIIAALLAASTDGGDTGA